MTNRDRRWDEESDDEILAALKTIVDYRDDVQEQICLEAEKRGLLPDAPLSFVLDQIRGRVDGSRPGALVNTVDVSKAARLRARTQFAQRILISLGVLQILGSGAFDEDAILYAILGILNLLAAAAMFKRRRAATSMALLQLAIMTPWWGLMVVDDVARRGTLTHALPAVFASFGLAGIVCCAAALRLESMIRRANPNYAEFYTPFQAKYFQNRKDPKAVVALIGAFVLFVIGMALALFTIWVKQATAMIDPSIVPNSWEMFLLRIVGFGLALVGAPYLWSRARRIATVSARELRKRDQRPSILYLRSFGDDQIRFITKLERVLGLLFPLVRFLIRDLTFEESLVAGASFYGPVVALSEPGRKRRPIGAAREDTLEGTWTENIDQLVRDSVAVIAVIGSTPGLLWEFHHLRENASLCKLLLVVPPVDRHDLLQRMQALSAGLPEVRRVPFQLIMDGGLALLFQEGAEPLVIVSSSREEGDYFEAIRLAASYLVPSARADSA